MSSAELFGKLREYEMNMFRMADEEQKDRKSQGLALKAEYTTSESKSSTCESESEEEELNQIVKEFKRFMKRKNNKKRPNQSREGFKKSENSFTKFICHECGKVGHIRPECPNLKRQSKYDQRRHDHDEKKKEKFKKKKAYIWDDNDVSTSSGSE
ncbi:hypothetical protein Fmac_025212 [Flemingia macrophylla]|uniref:CCHC-type domain-containing protein n=1 Tax=Flemingia macrophylla TaxID=520843 RepID=A0ABD1LRJ9_9FABA